MFSEFLVGLGLEKDGPVIVSERGVGLANTYVWEGKKTFLVLYLPKTLIVMKLSLSLSLSLSTCFSSQFSLLQETTIREP